MPGQESGIFFDPLDSACLCLCGQTCLFEQWHNRPTTERSNSIATYCCVVGHTWFPSCVRTLEGYCVYVYMPTFFFCVFVCTLPLTCSSDITSHLKKRVFSCPYCLLRASFKVLPAASLTSRRETWAENQSAEQTSHPFASNGHNFGQFPESTFHELMRKSQQATKV